MPSASCSTCRALSVPEPPSEASAEKGKKERDHAKVRAILVLVMRDFFNPSRSPLPVILVNSLQITVHPRGSDVYKLFQEKCVRTLPVAWVKHWATSEVETS
jgi:hypothetical protein